MNTLSEAALVRIGQFAAWPQRYTEPVDRWDEGPDSGGPFDRPYWWLGPGVREALHQLEPRTRELRLVGRRFAEALSPRAALERAYGAGAGARLVEAPERPLAIALADHLTPPMEAPPVFPALAWVPEPDGPALLGRALAALDFHRVAAEETFQCECCRSKARVQLVEGFHDGLALRQWPVAVVDVEIHNRPHDPRERRPWFDEFGHRSTVEFRREHVAAVEALHRYARALLPEGAVGPLPAELCALASSELDLSFSPEFYAGRSWGDWAPVDLRRHLRWLDEEDKYDKAPTPYYSLVTPRCVVTRDAFRLVPLPIPAQESEWYRGDRDGDED